MKPDAVVLIHGLWMTPRSWDPFRGHFEAQNYRVLTPPWPRLVGDVDDIRRDSSPLNGLGIAECVDHYENIIRGLDGPPIIMGHSFGGLYVQMLIDRGLGAAGVAIDAAAPKGVRRLPATQIKALSPVLLNPANRKRTVALTYKEFRYGFANTMSESDAQAAFEREAIPGPGRPVFQAGLANLDPKAVTKVNFRNDDRAPLLLIAGGKDHIAPASLTKTNFELYGKSKAITDYKEFPERSHFTIGEPGWEQVADYALDWAVSHATRPAAV